MKEAAEHRFPLISILINNFNYASYLKNCILSAINQDYPNFEVILVDDGSTDGSLDVARQFSDRLRIIAKKNCGQASAFNTGFANSKGDWVIFLDSDDILMPNALSELSRMIGTNVAKIHFPLRKIYQTNSGAMQGDLIPSIPLSTGNVLPIIAADGNYIWPPTSGNLFSRASLTKLLPMDEAQYRLCADLYLCLKVAPLGEIRAVTQPLGFYRIHGKNGYTKFSLNRKHLRARILSLIQHQRLADDVSGLNVGHRVWEFRDAVEIGILARRFGDCSSLGENFQTLDELGVRYKATNESMGADSRQRFRALVNWWILRYGPGVVVTLIMRIRIWKAHRATIRQSRSSTMEEIRF